MSSTEEQLLDIAERSPGAVSDWLDDLGEAGAVDVAAATLAEIAARATLLEPPDREVPVQLDLGLGARRIPFVLVLGPEPKVVPGSDPTSELLVRQDLAELIGLVFGPAPATATREVLPAEQPDPRVVGHVDRSYLARAARQFTAACDAPLRDLTELAVRFGSDKWGEHWYATHYDRHFAPLKDKRVTVLELGIGGYDDPAAGGASLQMWRHYFRRGVVHGLDHFPKTGLRAPRLHTHCGDQSDAAFLERLETGPLDIVIDDGSHLSHDVISSFRALFPKLRPGGLYVVEDLQTSYWPGWGGDRHDLDNPGTSVGMLKSLVDGLNHREFGRDPSYSDAHTTALHFYHNMAFIEKGVNSERPAPSWVPRDENPFAAGLATPDE
ncbi:demethylmacrocin O-methyltransferase [Saccharothrix ecbatanensis]|uniref:Demethylmacrocin O-methyltransferase n=1 Tax=Saccharothrix ecbatanensis TaxID=1105145 RepID=A0A7W9HJY4_9PSEU|nr:class I SAM-dependent methyltransferase [Saccharothrix ecbatanensis]MBB5803214.1 demethylmacrocin O-methyltransferase [Saccharothrix ecbatanensis]